MKIGMILDKEFPPDPRVENEAVTLVQEGHEVFLFCLTYNASEKREEVINGIRVKRYLSSKIEYKLSALAYTVPFYTFLIQKKITSFLNEVNVDAMHIHDIRVAEAAFKAAEKCKLPVVLDLHDNLPEIMKFYPHLQKFPGKYLIKPSKWKIKEEYFIKKAEKVITVSNEFMEEVLSRVPSAKKKISVVPNTIRRAFYNDYTIEQSIIEKYKNSFVILYLGDTGIRRGLLTTIEAMPTLAKTIKNCKLVIVGTNTSDTILKEKVKELNISNLVDFEGWKDMELFPSYIIASSICISPLYRNIQHDVAYPNKIFQYSSFEKPILVSDAKAQKSIVENKKIGLVHKEKDSDDFAEKVLLLHEDEQLRKELGSNGKKFIENEFCWEKTSRSLINLYREFSN
ncbi:MAG: glycosyltransferase family 4 protein [Flavobacteriaceae bacterium]|jgi:glycosyltransferase involved in cell wall biosynthesis|nr:glycosyltransferase family 4 protein [Flavobacteriaceae bacterium]